MKIQLVLGILWGLFSGKQSFIVRDSVIFEKIKDIHTSQSFWKLTLVENLENYSPELETVSEQLSKLHDQLRYLHNKVNSEQWTVDYKRLMLDSDHLRGYFNELREEYEELQGLTNKDDNNRDKRSLIPLVGTLTSFLFGTTSEADLAVVKRNLRTLENNQKQLNHVVNESLSFMNITNTAIGSNRHTLNEVIGTLKALNDELKQQQIDSNNQLLEAEQIIRIYLQSQTALERAKTNVAIALRQLQTLQLQFNMLSVGKLSPVIIKPKTLGQILAEIKSKLSPPFQLYEEPRTHLWDFYKQLKLTTVIHDNKLLMIINYL